MQQEGSTVELALPFVRPAVLLWLATLGRGRMGRTRRPGRAPARPRPRLGPRRRFLRARRPSATAAPVETPSRSKAEGRTAREALRAPRCSRPSCSAPPTSSAWSATAEEAPSGRRVVQLSPLGRYVLALGPPPPPRPSLRTLPLRPAELRDHRLSPGADPGADRPVQPVRAVVAGRRGAGAEADARVGLPRPGRGPDARRRCSTAWRGTARGPLPAGVAEALRTWAGRRDRVTYHASATLIEFATPRRPGAGPGALAGDQPRAPVPVSDRLPARRGRVGDPFPAVPAGGLARLPPRPRGVPRGRARRRDAGARPGPLRPAGRCRAGPVRRRAAAGAAPGATPGNPTRRFRITPASLARGVENGLSLAVLLALVS